MKPLRHTVMAAVQFSWGDVKKDGRTAETNQVSWPRAAKRRRKMKTQLMWLLHLIMPSLGLQVISDECYHSPFLGTESSFYRRSKINKYTRRLLKTRRGRLDITLWPYEDYSITQDDLPRMTRWGTITWRELLHETRWLDEDDSTRVTRRGDDSKRTTRRGSHDEARWFDETTLSHKGGTSVLRIVLTSLFIFFFQSFEMFSLLLITFMANPLFFLL